MTSNYINHSSSMLTVTRLQNAPAACRVEAVNTKFHRGRRQACRCRPGLLARPGRISVPYACQAARLWAYCTPMGYGMESNAGNWYGVVLRSDGRWKNLRRLCVADRTARASRRPPPSPSILFRKTLTALALRPPATSIPRRIHHSCSAFFFIFPRYSLRPTMR